MLCELKGDRSGKFSKGGLFRLFERNRNVDSIACLNVFGKGSEDLFFEYMKQKLELPAILERFQHRDFVGILQVAAHGNAHRDPRHFHAERLQET